MLNDILLVISGVILGWIIALIYYKHKATVDNSDSNKGVPIISNGKLKR